ncbi:MAG: branched-chain amino acid ABC transporter permease [Ruminococcaceae bacterium]|nr:branched-chain amino acid ABC transporter permease [Oscillospiraceae bacterium]
MLLQLLISGVSMGMIYGLMAMGLILIVKAVGVLNFAHGDLFMFGAYLAYMLTYQLNFPLWLMLPSALILFGIVGIIFMFSVYWPLRNAAWPVTITISTLGASMALKELVRFIWGPFPLKSQPIIEGSLRFGEDISIEYQYLFIIGIGALLMLIVFMLFEKLYIGRLMQATAQDRYAAELMGIPTIIAIMATYMISITIASIGGWLAAPLFLVSQSLGSMSLKAFAGIVVGGFGNVKGAVVGSLLIGIIEAYSTLLTSVYKDAIVFLFLILVLLIRPQGIFGERIADKA